jgi:hypothetical protein
VLKVAAAFLPWRHNFWLVRFYWINACCSLHVFSNRYFSRFTAPVLEVFLLIATCCVFVQIYASYQLIKGVEQVSLELSKVYFQNVVFVLEKCQQTYVSDYNIEDSICSWHTQLYSHAYF